jgi:hypothetical protein
VGGASFFISNDRVEWDLGCCNTNVAVVPQPICGLAFRHMTTKWARLLDAIGQMNSHVLQGQPTKSDTSSCTQSVHLLHLLHEAVKIGEPHLLPTI